MLIGAAAAWREVLYFLSQFECAATAAYWYFCGALNYFLALVRIGLVPTAGVFVNVSGFAGEVSRAWDWALDLGSTRSSSCLAAEMHSKWCRLVGGIVLWCRLVGGIVLAVAV